jgi:hypothetical protein
MKGAPMKTYSLELVLFGWLAYNILIELTDIVRNIDQHPQDPKPGKVWLYD